MGGRYTGTSEVFGDTPRLEERLEESLAHFGVLMGDVEIDNSNGRATGLNFTDNQMEVLNEELQVCHTNKEKFVKCLEVLRTMRLT